MLPKFLTDAYSLEKHVFLIPRFALNLIGFYPETRQTWLVKFWAFFNFFVLTYGCYAEFYYGIYHLTIDIGTALDALCPVASSIMSWVKMMCIWWYRDELKILIQKVRTLNAAQISAEKTEVKKRYFTIATQLTWAVLFFGFLTSTSYTIRNLWMNSVRYLNGVPIVYETPFKMMFPAPLLRMPIYPLTFAFSHWHGYITVCCFTAGDGVFFSFCIYITTLLKALAFDLKQILNELSDNERTRRLAEDEVCYKLTQIIERHNEIVGLTSKFSNVMVVLTLGHFVTSSLIIGTSVIDLLLFPVLGILTYVVYTICVTTEIFIFCLGGTAVMESSSDLATVAYSSHWYSYSLKIQKMVLLIMIRTQRAMVIKVPFFAPSLPALTSILRFTGSLIALANQLL